MTGQVMVRILPVPLPSPPTAPFDTVIGRRLPFFAWADTFIVAVILVELITLTLLKVTPAGPIRVAPLRNPAPVIVTDLDAPSLSDDGAIDFTVGSATMLRTLPVPLPSPPATPLDTVTGRSLPAFALEATFTVAVILVELITVILLKVTPAGPVTVGPFEEPGALDRYRLRCSRRQ